MTNIFNNTPRIFYAISFIGLISTFLPWVNTHLLSPIPGIKEDRIISLILFSISLFIIFVSQKSYFITDNLIKIITSINCIIYSILMWELIQLSQLSVLGIGFWGAFLSSGFGIVLGVSYLNASK
jgi:hypothetical protein